MGKYEIRGERQEISEVDAAEWAERRYFDAMAEASEIDSDAESCYEQFGGDA